MLRLRLSHLMKRKGMSVNQLSEYTGVNRASLTQLINNESKMVKFETLDKIINVLNIDDVYDLFEIARAGVIAFSGSKHTKKNQFITTLRVDMQPVRGQKELHETVEYCFTLKNISSKVSLLEGSPLASLSPQLLSAFDWVTMDTIHRFTSSFIGEIFGDDLYSEPDLPPIIEPELLGDLSENSRQLFCAVESIPELSSISTATVINGRVGFMFLPADLDRPVQETDYGDDNEQSSDNGVLLLSDLHRRRDQLIINELS